MEQAKNSTKTAEYNSMPSSGGHGFNAGDLASFLDEAACREHILQAVHGTDARCPGCDVRIQDTSTLKNFWGGKRCVCKRCGRWFTALSGTFLQGMQLDFRTVLLIAVLADCPHPGLNVSYIARLAGVSPKTVRIWLQRLRLYNSVR